MWCGEVWCGVVKCGAVRFVTGEVAPDGAAEEERPVRVVESSGHEVGDDESVQVRRVVQVHTREGRLLGHRNYFK